MLSWLLYTLLFIVYPLRASIAVAQTDPMRSPLLHWLLYWIAFSVFLVTDALFSGLLLYDLARHLGLLAMMSPSGSAWFRSVVLLKALPVAGATFAKTGLQPTVDAAYAWLALRLNALPGVASTLAPLIAKFLEAGPGLLAADVTRIEAAHPAIAVDDMKKPE
jgi:hypothetical protein